MTRRMASLGLMALAGVAIGPVANAESLSPIFGTAAVKPLTTAQNKSVVGKGAYADYYGSYGIQFANYASLYGQYGNYGTATTYASYAYQYFSAAASYQAAGY